MYYHPLALRGVDISNESVVAKEGANPMSRLVIKPAKRRLATVHRTLVPGDGSDHATQAIVYLLCTANHAPSAEVHFVNVQPLMMQGDFALNAAVRMEMRAGLAAAQEVLDRARALFDATGIPPKTTVLFGDPAKSIARYAVEHGIDAIVMGTRGLGSLHGLLRRSVAAKVMALADVPVTLVKSVKGLAHSVRGRIPEVAA